MSQVLTGRRVAVVVSDGYEPVVVDDGLVTSRRPGDIPVFNETMIEEFARGPHDAAAPDRAILAPCGCMP
jgi:putative intracellular protease/amidase